jgi:hypothetical protein
MVSHFFPYTGTVNHLEQEPVAKNFTLKQNYPNPFNPTTIINYELGITNYVKLIVYDLLGREAKTLVDKKQPAGSYRVTFDASGLASGIYYYQLIAEDYVQIRKMLLLR